MLDKQIIAELGGAPALIAAGYTLGQVKQWRRRGITWEHRARVAILAERKNVELPSDFLVRRRPDPNAVKPKRAKTKKRARASA